MEEALHIRREVFGENSDEFYKSSEKLCEICNMLSMQFLDKDKYEPALEFLKKAELLGQNSLDLKAITYNNYACYYKKVGKIRIALKYLQDAIAIETKLGRSETLADTHLNICAVYSQLGRHDLAKEHIMQSIILLQDEFLAYAMPSGGSHHDESDKKRKVFEDRVAVLSIAYHNLGVEYEYLKQFDEAILTYKKAVNFAKNHLGDDHKVVNNLQNVLAAAQGQIEEMKLKAKPAKKTSTKTTFSGLKQGTSTQFKRAQTVYNQPNTISKPASKGTFYNSKGGSANQFDSHPSHGNIDSRIQSKEDDYLKYDYPQGEHRHLHGGFADEKYSSDDGGIEEKDSHLEQDYPGFKYKKKGAVPIENPIEESGEDDGGEK
jgi:tetratricopeptide (TPR) repeat protein